MCADHGAINDGSDFVDLYSQLAEDIGPRVLRGPVGEAVVDGLPRPESLGKISPRNARLGTKHHRIDEQPITTRGLPSLRTPRKDWLQSGPLLVGQRVPVHDQF